MVVGSETLIWENDSNAKTERERQAAENGSGPYNDSGFRLSDNVNNYGNTPDQIFRVKQEGRTFVDHPGPDDIAQGEAGDCWFLSSLCSFVNEKEGEVGINPYINKVINTERNKVAKNGSYLFTFFKMGEWQNVLIDDQLPLKIFETRRRNGKVKRGSTFNPDEVDEYWALLLEKAFAKLAGGYMKLEGGFPRCALTFLTGGITTSDLIDSKEVRAETKRTGIFEYLKANSDQLLCNASNYGNDEDDTGLIAGHAYSVEGYDVIQGTQIIKLRNPWGEGEWQGDWSDDWIEENKSRFSKSELNRLGGGGDDGCFWMTWDDFIGEFENLAVCHLPDPNDLETRVRGIFSYNGTDCPATSNDMCQNYLNSEKTFQFKLTVQGTSKKNVKFQLLMDLPVKPDPDSNADKRLIFFAVHKAHEKGDVDRFGMYKSDLVFPKLPLQRKSSEFKGYRYESFDYNGWIYELDPGHYNIVLASSPVDNVSVAATKFILRMRGPANGGKPLYKFTKAK